METTFRSNSQLGPFELSIERCSGEKDKLSLSYAGQHDQICMGIGDNI